MSEAGSRKIDSSCKAILLVRHQVTNMGRDIYCARLAPTLIWVGVNWNTACDFGYEYFYDTVTNRPYFLNWILGWRCKLREDDDPITILMKTLSDLERAHDIDIEEELGINFDCIDCYLLSQKQKMSRCCLPILETEVDAALDTEMTDEIENPVDGLFSPRLVLPLPDDLLDKCETLLSRYQA